MLPQGGLEGALSRHNPNEGLSRPRGLAQANTTLRGYACELFSNSARPSQRPNVQAPHASARLGAPNARGAKAIHSNHDQAS